MTRFPIDDGPGGSRTPGAIGVGQLPTAVKNVAKLIVLPSPSGGDDAATINPIINAAAAGSKVISAPGTYLMNSAPLTLKGGIDYDFTLSTFTSTQGSGHVVVLNKAALSSQINAASPTATDVSTTGVTYEVDSLTTSGTPTGGTFTMAFTWAGTVYTTGSIAWNASAAAVQTAVQASTGPYGQQLPASSVSCSGGALPTAVTITFTVQLVGPVTGFAIATNALTGGASPSASVSRTTPGTLGSATITSPQLVAAGATVGQTVQVMAAGPAPNPPNITGKITAIASNNITLGNDYNPVLAWQTLTNATAYLITRDQDIVVRGGKFVRTDTSGNGSGNATSAYMSGCCGVFRHCDRLSFSDISITDTFVHQTWNTADCTDYRYSNVRLSNAGDGLHIGGNSFRGTIEKVTGTTNDDFIAVLGRDFENTEDCAGDIRSIHISDIKQAAGAGFDFVAGAGCTLADVTVDGFYGLISQAGGTFPVRFPDVTNSHPACGGGISEDIVFRDIRPVATGYGAGIVSVRTLGMKNLTIDGLFSNSPSASNPTAIVSFNSTDTGLNSSIERLVINNMVVKQMPVAGTQAISLADCNIGKMTLSNSRFVLTANQFLIQLGTLSSIQNLLVSNVHAENVSPPGGSLVSMTPANAVIPSIKVTNYDATGLANLVDTGSTTQVVVSVANVNLTNHTNAALVRSGGNLRIQGTNFFSNNPISNSGTVSVDCPTLVTDANVLTPLPGDHVYNNNANLAGGTLPLIYDDGSGSVTGATLYSNGGFESGVTNFVASNSNTVASAAAPVHTGTASAQITGAGVGNINFFRSVGSPHDGAVITPGVTYIANAWVRAGSTSRNFTFVVNWYNSGGTFLVASNQIGSSATDVSTGWTLMTYYVTAPASAAQYQLQIRSTTAPANGELHYVDDVSFFQVGTPAWRPVKTPYFASGTATLVAGTVAATCPAATTNAHIRYWVQAAGGTQGNLSAVCTNPGVITFTSTNAADTSTLYWELATP